MIRAAALLALAACASPRSAPPGAPSPSVPPPGAREVIFEGMCDASGAVELGLDRFVVADDEDNVLRIYDAERGGPPLAAVDVSAEVGLEPRGKKRRFPELDLEAGTRIGDRAYWLTSHGLDSKQRPRPERLRFFATTVPVDGVALAVVGEPHDGLIAALIADPRFAAFGLAAAAARGPKEAGGLNLEGMTATPQGTLLLGFRNPVPDGRALFFELLAPADVVAGAPPAFGDPFQLDLGGLGVRALTWWRGRYLIVAGAFASGGASRLYTWDGAGAAAALPIDLAGYNPEGTFTPEGRSALMLLSDDGERVIDGRPCKKLEPARRRFRGLWIEIGSPADRAKTE